MGKTLFDYWRSQCTAPYHFPMTGDQWYQSMYEDVDGDGHPLFSTLIVKCSRTTCQKDGEFTGLIEYGETAFGFDTSGEISSDVHHNVIRILCFDRDKPEVGEQLLHAALDHFGTEQRIYAFFHYFGMTACARHGKLHESSPHVEALLLNNGFTVEHENIYYARILSPKDTADDTISLRWSDLSPGGCREFAALTEGVEVGWGQVHFLPQGDIAYLRWIYVDEKRQHQGLGTAIMRQLFAELYQLGIRRFDTDTALSNTAAQHYYEKTGFANAGITRSYYTK
ncbi:MAG: GNAT family N-acetyltransferase [Oscillospiraceae bacterium]|nr:GNAT family N-acetyltransferase [Oscillospiraceae bacterium]